MESSFLWEHVKERDEEIHIDNYLWHLFSNEKVTPVLLNDEAKRQFECADKSDIYIFNQHDGSVYRIIIPSTL